MRLSAVVTAYPRPCLTYPPIPPFLQGVGATPGCVRRRGRLAEMQLEEGRVEEAEKLLRNILAYVESTQVGRRAGEEAWGGEWEWQLPHMPCLGRSPLHASNPRHPHWLVPQGLEHANYSNAAENLAAALQRKGQWDEARHLMHKSLETRSTHVGARHPVVAITLRKLSELELAAAAADEAAAAEEAAAAATAAAADGEGGASAAGAAPAAPAVPLKERERQQAVAIALEALSIAQQAYGESLAWESRQGKPEEGGLMAWLRPNKVQLSSLRRPQRPDSAALEVAHCLQTLARAQAATADEVSAAASLESALKLLDDAFPAAAAARASCAASTGEEEQDDQQVSQGNNTTSSSNGSEEEEEAAAGGAAADASGSNERSAASLAATLSAREHARALRVEKARQQVACSMLAQLMVLAQGGRADLAVVQQRFAQEGCS